MSTFNEDDALAVAVREHWANRCCNKHHYAGCCDDIPGCCPRCPINPTS